jgi:hypothetical protein
MEDVAEREKNYVGLVVVVDSNGSYLYQRGKGFAHDDFVERNIYLLRDPDGRKAWALPDQALQQAMPTVIVLFCCPVEVCLLEMSFRMIPHEMLVLVVADNEIHPLARKSLEVIWFL